MSSRLNVPLRVNLVLYLAHPWLRNGTTEMSSNRTTVTIGKKIEDSVIPVTKICVFDLELFLRFVSTPPS